MTNNITFSYYIICNSEYKQHKFKWGLFLLIVLSFGMIIALTPFSKAYSYGGNGIIIHWYFLVLYIGILGIGIAVGYF